MDDKLNQIYTERNNCIIAAVKFALAAGHNAGRGMCDNEGWPAEWRHVVYINLPDGKQVSYHIAPEQVHMLDGLPAYTGTWDGTYLGRDPAWANFKLEAK